MKNRTLKRGLCLVLAPALAVSLLTNAWAAELTGTSAEGTPISGSSSVTFSNPVAYTVSIPDTIDISAAEEGYSGTGTVSVSGIIDPECEVVVSVDQTMVLKELDGVGGSEVPGGKTIDVSLAFASGSAAAFRADEATGSISGSETVTATIAQAKVGYFAGTATYSISYQAIG